jgi:hypothetical protein
MRCSSLIGIWGSLSMSSFQRLILDPFLEWSPFATFCINGNAQSAKAVSSGRMFGEFATIYFTLDGCRIASSNASIAPSLWPMISTELTLI